MWLYLSESHKRSESILSAQMITPANFADFINEIGDEVNTILNGKKKERYFETIALLYSFTENMLKWLVYANALWERSSGKISLEDEKAIHSFCKRISFYQATNLAYLTGLVDLTLYNRIEKAREERNRVIHQFWRYQHRGNQSVMRKKLEKLAGIANELVSTFNRLTKKIGVEEIYEVFL